MMTRECKNRKRNNQPEVVVMFVARWVVMHASKLSLRECKKMK